MLFSNWRKSTILLEETSQHSKNYLTIVFYHEPPNGLGFSLTISSVFNLLMQRNNRFYYYIYENKKK
ncbi:MAG: hypothetical protein BGO70_01040 [Bacteroidetes bacterium 43-93]|nr:MAG: hypothetical protein BGO70_01040 [Bacteroidetes bacterium 43-93]